MHNIESADQFASEVLAAPEPVVVDFTAKWCGPCQKLAPVLRDLAARFTGQVRVVAVDVEHTPDLAQAYGVAAMPTLLVFEGGEVTRQITGFSGRRRIDDLFADLAGG